MSAEKILFYNNPLSRARTVHWMLEEVGVPYDMHLLNLQKGEHKKADYLAVNPMGKVPAISHRGSVITEVGAICLYLADTFPDKRLAPVPGDSHRGSFLRWIFFSVATLEPAVIDKQLQRAPAKPVSLTYGVFEDAIRTSETALRSGPYILGEAFSAADVCFCSQIGFGLMTKAIEAKPIFTDYVERCSNRPAYKSFLAQANALVEKLK